MGKVQSDTTCNVYIAKRFLHSLPQQNKLCKNLKTSYVKTSRQAL